jgi:hypothetical protein
MIMRGNFELNSIASATLRMSRSGTGYSHKPGMLTEALYAASLVRMASCRAEPCRPCNRSAHH